VGVEREKEKNKKSETLICLHYEKEGENMMYIPSAVT